MKDTKLKKPNYMVDIIRQSKPYQSRKLLEEILNNNSVLDTDAVQKLIN